MNSIYKIYQDLGYDKPVPKYIDLERLVSVDGPYENLHSRSYEIHLFF